MMAPEDGSLTSSAGTEPLVRRHRRVPEWLIGLALFTFVLLFGMVFVDRLGLHAFLFALGGLSVVIILAYLSLKEVSFALVAWLLIMSGFRYLGMVSMPVLPDISLDRILLVWIILMFILRIAIWGERLRGPFLPDFLLLAHVVYILVQMQFIGSMDHFHHWVLSMLTPFFGFLYGKHTIKRDSEIKNLMYFFLILSLYYALMSIAQHFDWKQIIWPKSIMDPTKGLWHAGRSRGPVLHPPYFGQLIAIVQLVFFFFLVRTKRYGLKTLLLIGLGASLIGLLFTYTRGPWLAAVLGIILLAALSPGYRKIIAVMAIIGLLGGALGVVQMANTEFLRERMENTNTVENRLGFMANAFRVVKAHPIFGLGYYQWMNHLGEYNQTTFVPFYGMIRKETAAHVPIHDIYVGRLAEEGIVGSFLQFSFYFVIFRAWLRKWRAGVWSDWFNRDLMAMMAGMMLVYLVGGMVIDFRYFDLVNVLFYFFAGLIYGYDPAAGGSTAGSETPRVPVSLNIVHGSRE